MKKLLTTLIIIMMTCTFHSFAQEKPIENTKTVIVHLDIRAKDNIDNRPLRSLPFIDIEAFYNPDFNSIDIVYTGEQTGTVLLYNENGIVRHSSELNVSFKGLESGSHRIEIIGEMWFATGIVEIL